MKIAHVTATFPPYQGGTGNVCFHNARELAHRGNDVHVFTASLPGEKGEHRSEGFTVHRLLPLLRFGNARLLPQLVWGLRGFDLIHLHYPFFGGELAALAAWLHHTPLVITYHHDVLLLGWMAGLEKLLRWTIGRAALCSATQVLFTSQDYGQGSFARQLLKGREAVFGELPNGVDACRFRPGPPLEALRERYMSCPETSVALLVAGLDRAHYFKGVGIFLQALALLPESIRGVIVGDGDLRAGYQAMAGSLGISDRVFFAGRVPDEELADYYRLAGVTVLPSVTMGEAFGLVLVESMACGTPVIASNLCGVRTVVDDCGDGFLVAPGQPADLAGKIKLLLSDIQLREEMGRRGRSKVVEKYEWSKIGDQLEQVYSKALAVRGSRLADGAGSFHG